MSSIWVFDVASMDDPATPDGIWYEQTAVDSSGLTNVIPPPGIDFSLCGEWAPDNSSYNIYMHGGRNDLMIYYDEMWVLTLPSFTWIKANTADSSTPYPRYGHTCHIVQGTSQMLIVGGTDSSVYTEQACDQVYRGVEVYDLNLLTGYVSRFNETSESDTYKVATYISTYIGGK
jgi:Kelch motif